MRRATLAVAVAAASLFAAPVASATYPGENGKVATVLNVGTDQIFTFGPNGFDLAQLTGGEFGNAFPQWSADGEEIVFASARNGTFDIFTMRFDGSDQAPVRTDPSGAEIQPSFSPDGSRIAFSGSAGGDNEIYVMNRDGSNVVPLTDNAVDEFQPSFSPDGQRIVFVRFGPDLDVFVMNADGSGQTNLTTDLPDAATSPRWTPDGQRISFSAFIAATTTDEVLTMNPNGSNKVPLTSNTDTNDNSPVFSPDGTQVLFFREFGPFFEFWRMSSSGADQQPFSSQPLDPEPGARDWQPLNDPVCNVTGAPKQKSAKQVTVTVQCDEDASVSGSGLLSTPKPKKRAVASKRKRVLLGNVTLDVAPGTATTLTLTPAGRKGRKLLKKSLKAGKKAKGTIEVTATDDLGLTDTDSFAVKLKKKR